MAALSASYRKLLENHPDNPDPSQHAMSASTTGKPPSFARSTTLATSKPSLKEVMAAQKAAAAAKARILPSRPGSAQSSFSPDKVPAPSVSGGLNSKPVRPMKAARRIEVPRPATADPYSVRRSAKPETTVTPGQSAIRPRTKLPSPVASPSKTKAKPRRVGSPVVAPISHPARAKDDTSSPSKSDEELTMVLPTSLRPSSRGNTSAKDNAAYPELEILQVYEDPATNPGQQTSPPPAPKAQVLHELTLNEPSNPYAPSPARIQSQQELKRGAQESVPSSMSAENGQRLVNSGINRIEAGTLDIYGYRQLQKIIKTQSDLWTGSRTFGPLLGALLKCLERPIEISHSRTPSKSKIHQPIAPAKKNEPSKEVLKTLDLRSQALATIREMFNHNQALFIPHLSQTICSLLLSRRHYDQAYHIVTSYDVLSASLVEVADPSPTIAAVLDQLSSPSVPLAAADNKNSTTSMSVNVLRGLLHNASQHNIVLPQSQIQRLGAFTVAALQNNDPDVRRAITDYSNELYRHAGQGFWDLLADAPEQARNVVAWSLAKRGTLETRDRTAA
jgi:CLIP-associating protein 1/2